MPSAARRSAPTRSASRPRRPATPAPTAGCCGTRATSTRPMKSKLKRLSARNVVRFLLACVVCQVAAACAAPPATSAPPAAGLPQPPTTTEAAREISSIVNQESAAGHLGGGVVVLGINDRIVLRQAYGQRAVMPEQKPATLDTIYDAASLTKVMATAVAIMQLNEQGRLELDRPVAA